jgi:hypothetical protein
MTFSDCTSGCANNSDAISVFRAHPCPFGSDLVQTVSTPKHEYYMHFHRFRSYNVYDDDILMASRKVNTFNNADCKLMSL